MDSSSAFKTLTIMLVCFTFMFDQTVVHSRVVKTHSKQRRDKAKIGRYREFYDSIVETCVSEQNYMCKFDLNVPELRHPVCIPFSFVCDGIPQCPMQDDEHGCPEQCSRYQMRCSDGSCATICNHKPECHNLEDELYCAPLCDDGYLRCPDGNCARVCDGVMDCSSGADEINCRITKICERGAIVCSDLKTCATVCNGIQECYDGADERNCLPKCPYKSQMICPSGNCGFTCNGIPECTNDQVYGVYPDERNCS